MRCARVVSVSISAALLALLLFSGEQSAEAN